MIDYIHTEEIHNLTAPREVVPLLIQLTKPKSVLDVGCGTGTWLNVFDENGVKDFLGVDGDFVNRSLLKIKTDNFIPVDLRKPLDLKRRFDLVVCLEVAEHLSIENADVLINSLVNHSDQIIFSAAIPNQGGQNHLNEQWPDYWAEKFYEHGYYFHDTIRPIIWNNSKIDWWYRQNIFLVNKTKPERESALSIVHPELFNKSTNLQNKELELFIQGRHGVAKVLPILLRSVVYSIKNKFNL